MNSLLEDNVFTFELSGEGETWTKTATQGNTAIFDEFTYTMDNLDATGKAVYTYTIRELEPEGAEDHKEDGIEYDTHVETVTIVVENNKKGDLEVTYNGNKTFTTPAFTNTYTANGSAQLSAKKASNSLLEDNVFTFELSGNGHTWTKTATQGNTAIFDEFTYTMDDLDATGKAVYTYTIRELEPEGAEDHKKDGIEYDTHVETVTIVVENNKKGELEVTYNGNKSSRRPSSRTRIQRTEQRS